MNYWLLIIPILTAFAGWITVFFINKMFIRAIPRIQPDLSKTLGELASREFASFPLGTVLEDPRNFENIKPLVETHVDDFLRKKLPVEMPMIGMFIGDKTIDTLKIIFIREVEGLFPQVMKQFAGNLIEKTDMSNFVATRLASMPAEKITASFYLVMKKQWSKASLSGFIIGLLVGVIQLGILLIIL